ncbi:MAG: hypothetical protein ACRD1C_14040 [Terriglobales bacterium]
MTEKQVALLRGAIDYAGLFPPARLEMEPAVENYRRYRVEESSWALGRFVCPVGRLAEFAAARRSGGGIWPIAAVGSGEAHEEASAIARFNQDHYGRSCVEALEAKTPDGSAVRARAGASGGLQVFCEISPAAAEFRATATAVREAGARAKLRTGGVVPEAIPSVEAVLSFLLVCLNLGLAFKATAGLHHACRGLYALNYGPRAPEATMHGYMNLALAATALVAGEGGAAAEHLLASSDVEELSLESWSVEQIEAGRRLFVGFGSCSFEEPLQCLHPQA